MRRASAHTAGKRHLDARVQTRAIRQGLAILGAAALLALAAPLRAETATDPLAAALRLRIEALRLRGDARIGAGSIAARSLIASLYERRGFAPWWSDPARARALRAAIEASTTHGLDPRDYHYGPLATAAAQAATEAERLRARVELELLHTDAFLRLAYHLYFGKIDPRAIHPAWNFSRALEGVDPVEAAERLLGAADPSAALEGLAPRLPAYRALRDALARLREIERAGGWPVIAPGARLEVGASGSRVAQLRARLRASGDLADAGDDARPFDEALAAAVRRFQLRHGLQADGIVGRATLAALNVGVADRIAQVRANLERLRWFARELKGDYLLVDVAGFTAELWLDDALAWSARVVAGRPDRRTPELRATMKYVVLNPQWHVPPTILREDVLPQVLADPSYLVRNRMAVLDSEGRHVDAAAIDWAQLRANPRAFAYRIVQAPGAENPMGAVKFVLPNEHAVNLHDTPDRELFERASRAFSSGCIRVERPLELARLLLDDPARWSEDRLREAIATGRTQTLAVRRAVAVLLLYFTTRVDADGALQFRPDLYRRDRPIIAALASPMRFAPIEAGRRAAAAARRRAPTP